jgi:hypothetical protein
VSALGIAKHNDSNCVILQILLEADIFVGSDQYMESGVLSGL